MRRGLEPEALRILEERDQQANLNCLKSCGAHVLSREFNRMKVEGAPHRTWRARHVRVWRVSQRREHGRERWRRGQDGLPVVLSSARALEGDRQGVASSGDLKKSEETCARVDTRTMGCYSLARRGNHFQGGSR